jgi:hypothetical protein
LARFHAAILRVQRHLGALKRKEFSAANKIQKVGRGYRSRHLLKQSSASSLHPSRGDLKILHVEVREQLSSIPPAYLVISSQYEQQAIRRAGDVDFVRAIERESQHIPVYVESQARLLRDAVAQRIHPHELRMQRAAEQHVRSLELHAVLRERSAKIIQRFFRRWRAIQNVASRERRTYDKHCLQKNHFDASEARRVRESARLRLRQTNDLSREARAAKEALQEEIQKTLPLIRDGILLSEVRSPDERRKAAQRLHEKEVLMARQAMNDRASLRSLPQGTFRTARQQKLLQQGSLQCGPSVADS